MAAGAFHTAAGEVAMGSKRNPPLLRDPNIYKELPRHAHDDLRKRAAAAEEKVRKNALELRSAPHGAYPGDASEPRVSCRSSSSVSGRRYQSNQRPPFEAAASLMQREPSAPEVMTPMSRMRGERSASARPYPSREQGLPCLDRSFPSPLNRAGSESGKRGYQQREVPVQASRPPTGAASQPSRPPRPGASKCDKCDGAHATDACPHFKKSRDSHKDAWANYGTKSKQALGAATGNFVLRSGRCVRQPGDGNCLFHSLCFGLNDGKNGRPLSAGELRGQLASFVMQNPGVEIAGDSLEEWVQWDTNSTARNYASRMARGGWGGGIEMAACSMLKKVNVHVYERSSGGFKRISCFDCPGCPAKTIHVLYQGGVHYDALVPSQ